MRWLLRPALTRARPLVRIPLKPQLRRSSTTSDYRVDEVPCGSSGSVPVSLYNASETSLPLLIYIPPFPTPSPSPDYLPSFLRRYPTAVIHYRWASSAPPNHPCPLHWPIPLHDVSFAYSHLLEAFSPAFPARRSIYVLSSHVGASLATSLALTESHPHKHFAVRGLAVHNGVYNWSMFLPDHRVHKSKGALVPVDRYGCDAIEEMGSLMPGLFKKTANIFDPFASPTLFFRTAGMDIPSSFTHSETLVSQIDHLAGLSLSGDDDPMLPSPPPPPRRAALVFPPRTSTLKIPETQLLYTRPPPLVRRKRRAKAKGNTFETQALEFAEVMRRSVEREVKERMTWDDEVGDDVPNERVRTHDLGEKDGSGTGAAEGVLLRWLEEKFGF